MKAGKSRKTKPSHCGRRRKIRYRSLKDAKGARRALEAKVGTAARIYGCPMCGGYHLTTEAAVEWGDQRTVWQVPDRTISSREEPDSP